ncbi:hypothetical protein B0H13DRAFT_1858940 [Mycena leptocephala]|nr:hypothetical protein B0H13DRAFT_1858940 [Mycena leptocephala]
MTQLESILRLASRLEHIIRFDDVNKGRSHPSEIALPIAVMEFLAAALKISTSSVLLCWAGFGDFVGETLNLPSADEAFASMGPTLGTVADSLEPPTICTTDMCKNARLTKRQEFSGTFYVLPTYVPLNCKTTYHHNYQVSHAAQPGSLREYYEGIPDRIQVSMHHVVERELVVFWETQMVFSQQIFTIGDSLGFLFPSRLLRDATKRDIRLSVPHNGLQTDRLDNALEYRNIRMTGTGQYQWAHACKGCQKIIGTLLLEDTLRRPILRDHEGETDQPPAADPADTNEDEGVDVVGGQAVLIAEGGARVEQGNEAENAGADTAAAAAVKSKKKRKAARTSFSDA